MLDRTIAEWQPTMTQDKARELLQQFAQQNGEAFVDEPLIYCSWPQQFSNGAGPFKRVAPRALTTFRMEAWYGAYSGQSVVFCNGRLTQCVVLNLSATLGN